MRKYSVYFVLGCIAAFSVLLGAADAKKISFYYEFRPDATYRISWDIENDITPEFKGDVPEEYAQIPMMMPSIKSISRMEMEQKFGSPDEAGLMPFEAKFIDYNMKNFMSGQEMQLPAEMELTLRKSMMQMKMSGKMTRRGKLVEFDVSGTEDIPGFSSEEMKKIYSLIPEFPERELSAGDDFTYSFTAPLELGRGELAVKGEMTSINYYHLKEIREGAAYFDMKIDYQITMKSEKEESTAIKGSGIGHAVYDIEKHFFMTMNMEGDLSIVMDFPLEQQEDQKKGTGAPQIMSKMNMVTKMTTTLME